MTSESASDAQESAGMAKPDDVVHEFLLETRENLDQFDRDVIELERNPTAAETLGRIFRTLHTIKGASGFLNLSKLEAISHAGEGLLSRMRDERLLPNSEIASTLLELADCIRFVLTQVEAEGRDGDLDWQALANRIDRVQALNVAGSAGGADLLPGQATPGGTFAQLTESDAAKPIGQLLVERAGVSPVAVAEARQLQRRGDLRTMGEILVSQGAVSASLARSVIEYQQEARAATSSDSHVRVDISRLDKLINLATELGWVRDEIVRFSQRYHRHGLPEVALRLDAITTELQREAKQARTQPIGTLWGRLPRLARDLALAGGKQVRLKLEGQELELDKLVLEAIKDPLMHLVRNSIDHGIELPSRRLAAGKPPEGCLTVRAYQQFDEVCIEVSDDGAGIDVERVRRAAAAKGLLPAHLDGYMGPQEIADLVCLHGVTTAEKITNISGRGVGMDVVKANAQSLGGTVDVQTEMGKGTKVTMRIPLRSGSF